MLRFFVKKERRNLYRLSIAAILMLTMVIAIQIPITDNSTVIDSPSTQLEASASTDWTSPFLADMFILKPVPILQLVM